MALNPDISLSTAELIQNDIQHAMYEHSTVDTMGNLINNVKWKQGYDEFARGEKTEKSYVWEAISAVAQDFGQTLYQNVRDYIDNVSNVDTCKTRALKSMMRLVGSDYNVLDKIGYYPIEIQNLIDILSISKKFLLNNQYIKKDFLDACVADGVLSIYSPEDTLCIELTAQSADMISSQADYYRMASDESFYGYLSGVYANFIYDMLTLHGTGLCADVELYRSGFLSSMYGPDAYLNDNYLSAKKALNVDINFDVTQVVNDIEVGIDSIGNYTGDELSLLVREIDRRKAPASGLSGVDMSTRNIYYRQQKVVEYAEFVDNMVFLPVNFSSYIEYPYNKDYLTVLSNAQHHYCISSSTADDVTEYSIISDYVNYAAVSLAQITKYIAKIRDTIRLQVRKVFMKGTNNLLRFTANEFLIDYISTLKGVMPPEQVSAFVQMLSAHSVEDVAVQEYWDLTEYMNLSTSTTKYAVNHGLANDRFFDETFSRVNDKLVPDSDNIFTDEELNSFYLDKLDLKNTLVPALSSSLLMSDLSSNLYEFLSVLFDVAANTAYYNSSGEFGMKLANDVITEDINTDLLSAKGISAFIDDYAQSASYEFDGSLAVSEQLTSFSREVYNAVLEAGRDGISDVYDTYYPEIENLSGQMASLTSDFITLITKTYASYFDKSDSIYCYGTNGSYMFDYFIGNTQYMFAESYSMSSMTAREWINDEHCYTFALSAALSGLSSTYYSCKSQITQLIENDLQSINFIDPGTDDLDEEMNSIQTFVNSKITQRTTYLQSTLQALRDQAAQAKQDHASLQSTFSSILASMPTLPHQNFYMQGCNGGEGQYRLIESVGKSSNLKKSIYDAVSQANYIETKNYGTFKKVDCEYLDELVQIDSSQSLETQILNCLSAFETIGNISFGAGSTATRTIGTQKVTLQSLQAGINKITSITLPSIVAQLKSVFNIEVNAETLFNNKSCIEQVEALIAYLNNEVSDQQFNSDTVMSSYYVMLSKVNEISCGQYISAKAQYEAMWTQFESFFTDYAKDSNYKLYIPTNFTAVDKYRKTKDDVALAQINEALDTLDARYASLLQQFVDMCTNNAIKLYGNDRKLHQYTYNGSVLESSLEDFASKLVTDINVKDQLASEHADEIVNQIQVYVNAVQALYRKYFSHVIQYDDLDDYATKFDAMQTSFMQIIQNIIDKLEYTDEYEYTYSKELFKNYSGVPEVATDPYYNMKNQTHPSYQIHPFMWNFIERFQNDFLINQIARNVINLAYDGLQASKIASTIDGLLGKFGNVIDVWRNNIIDFTGYTTKYEQSNHVSKYTGRWSEVIGYEGAFYPPALSAYLSSPSLDSLTAYYCHMKLENDTDVQSMVSAALQDSYDAISAITQLHEKRDVYDIYKYYVDTYDNMYILYKQYATEDPTEQEKLATPGELWIRLAESPIAFPVSSIVDLRNCADAVPGKSSTSMTSIYDISMFESGAKLLLTGGRTGDLSGVEISYVQTKPLYIEYDVKSGCGAGMLKFVSMNMYSNEPNDQTKPFPGKPQTEACDRKYLGSLVRNSATIDVVYAQCNADGAIADDAALSIYPVTTDVEYIDPEVVVLSGLRSSSGDPVISNHDENQTSISETLKSYVDIMYTIADDSISSQLVSQHQGLVVGGLSAAEGYIYDDPVHESMNSLDLIEGQLVLKSVCMTKGTAKERQLQTNTDLGYTPSYPYGDSCNVLDIREDLSSSHQIVELLGKSKDLESVTQYVNTEPDPYLTMKDLCEKHMYGRIYEDDGIQHIPGDETSTSSYSAYEYWQGDDAFCDSIHIYSCWSMYPNMPNQHTNDYVFNYVNGHYQWTIRLDNRYSAEKLKTLRLFIYSTTSLGKNPYVVAEMSDVIDMSEALPENEFLSTNYNVSSYDVTTYSFMADSYTIAVGGTQNGIDQIDASFANSLPNVGDFTYKYSTLGGGYYLKLDFKMRDINAGGYIDTGMVKVALVDMYDLSFYNWYHFLDPGVTDDEYDTVLNRLSGAPLLKKDLLAIDFSNYSYLSDIQISGIQIFSTNRRLRFKIDEDDIFPVSSYNYYVPSLNIKYPLTMSQTFDKLYNIPDELLRSTVNIYDPYDVFELEVADAEVLSSLQTLHMAYEDVPDDFRVYEEYFHVDAGDPVANSSRYSPDDSYFYKYVHFMGSGCTTSPISIDQSACVDIRIDGTDRFSQALSRLGLSAMCGEQGFTQATYSRDFNFGDLDDSKKQAVIEHVKKFLRLHFTYQKTSAGIVLYVNYQNYINSPYVKIVNDKPYMALLPDTYLKVYPDESGSIDLVVQFRQYINDRLMSVHNITVARCKVHNVSDDKPKFVIERLKQL